MKIEFQSAAFTVWGFSAEYQMNSTPYLTDKALFVCLLPCFRICLRYLERQVAAETVILLTKCTEAHIYLKHRFSRHRGNGSDSVNNSGLLQCFIARRC